MSPTQRSSQVAALKDWYGIDRGTAVLLVELFHADQPLPRAWLAGRCEMSAVSIKVRISELRRVMDEGAIDTVAGYYGLTSSGQAELRGAFVAIATDLMQAMVQPRVLGAAA